MQNSNSDDDDDIDSDWKQCADWLMRCQVISRDQLRYYCQYVETLALYLKDGVLLCLLLNRIKPGAIEARNFSQRPQMSQFLCLKNIRMFLQTCKKVFNLQDKDLFDIYDLFDARDFSKVIHTLSILSHTRLASRVTEPFSKTGEYYNIVSDLSDEVEYNVVDNSNEDEEEDIYGRMIDYNFKASSTAPAVPTSKRDLCATELIETEKNYLDMLDRIMTKFMKPLKSLLTPEETKAIFFGIEDLHAVHSGLYADLRKVRLGSTTGPTIANTFLEWKMRLLAYGEYCSRLSRAHEQLAKSCATKPVVNAIVEKESEEGKVKLSDLLRIPVQRILKYHLLLKELIKNTTPDHREYSGLQDALAAMEDVGLYINEVKRDNESLDLIEEIEQSIVNLKQFMPESTRLRDYGRRLNDGELKIKAPLEKGFSDRYVFLFDRVLLICRATKGNSYEYKDCMNLQNYEVDVDSAVKNDGCFALVLSTDVNKRYVLDAKTIDLRSKWMSLIRLAKDNIKPAGASTPTHEFMLANVEQPTLCSLCSKLLRGTIYQGYRCRKTKMIVHKECIMKLAAPEASVRLRPAKGKMKALRGYDGNPLPSLGRKPLKFATNDVLELLSDSDSNWLEGRLDKAEGFFPKDRVSMIAKPKPGYENPTFSSGSLQRSPGAATWNKPGSSVPTTSPMRINSGKSIEAQPWFAGEIERDECADILKNKPSGTYLVRFKPSEDRYILSVRYDDNKEQTVKHIRVRKSPENGLYSLDQVGKFPKISDLVRYYEQHSLSETFVAVGTKLTQSYRDAQAAQPDVVPRQPGILGYCTALYDFSASEPNQLSFSTGDRIAVISKTGRYKLWWRGSLNGQTGYFPSNYVTYD